MFRRIKRWYEGDWIAWENDPNDSIIVIGGNYERHWTAEIARLLVSFYLKHWQWCWGTIIALVSLYVALLALKQ